MFHSLYLKKISSVIVKDYLSDTRKDGREDDKKAVIMLMLAMTIRLMIMIMMMKMMMMMMMMMMI